MTIDEFLKLLRKSPRKFFLRSGRIRAGGKKHEYCPITAVCKDVSDTLYCVSDYCTASDVIGLSISDRILLIYAADNVLIGKKEKLIRRQLLRATKIKKGER